MRKHVVAVLALGLLTACANLGLPQAQTFNQRVAYGYGVVKQVRLVTAERLKQKQISKQEATHILAVTDAATASLDRATELGDNQSGLQQLVFANEVLIEVQKLLERRSK